MRILKNQRGAALVLELALLVVVLGALGFVGWRYYQSQQEQVPTPSTTVSSNSTPVANQDPKYLTIAEWGVKMDRDSAGDFVIFGSPKESTYAAGDQSVEIKSQSLAKIWECTPTDNDEGTLASISRTTSVTRTGPYESTAQKKIGKYTFELNFIQNICSSDEKAEQSARKELERLFNTLASTSS